MAATDGDAGATAPVAVPLTSFVGRRREIAAISGALAASRLVTLTGPGGIGKTRLALRVAGAVGHRFADGVLVVDLEPIRVEQDVAAAIVDQLGLAPAGAVTPVQRLGSYLADRALLVVLDNAEHLLDASRAVVTAALGAGPGIRVLSTSRERLGISGERVLAVPPLPVPPSVPASSGPGPSLGAIRAFDSVRLLEERAAAVAPGFRLREEDAAAAAEVCVRLDGLPLAIELAATRLRSMSLAELAERLTDRFEMLNRGDPTARAQHRTLRAMVEWSWDLCSDAERRLWTTLSVFAGGADLEAVAAVGAAGASDPAVLDIIDGLVDKSVLTVSRVDARTRYRMLETLQEFGREELGRERVAGQDPARDERELRTAHARYYLALARRGCDAFYSPEQLAWTARLRADAANLVSAFEHLETLGSDGGRAALELASALRFHWLTGPWQEGRRVLGAALAGYPQPDEARLLALHVATWVALGQGDPASAIVRVAEADQIAAALDSPAWRPRHGVAAAVVRLYSGDPPDDVELGRLVDELAEAQGRGLLLDREYLLTALLGRVLLLLARGERDESRNQTARLLRECEACGDSWMRSNAVVYLALGAWLRRELPEAAQAAHEGLRLKVAFGDVFGIGLALSVLAGIAADAADARRSALLQGAVQTLNRSVGSERRSYGPSADGELTRSEAVARAALGERGFAETLAEGGAMPLEDVVALAHDVTRSAPSPPVPAGPPRGVLSAREYEVATLVSTGMTNRMIADHLVLSPRTIDGHLERILAKLGFRNRAEVAVWVVAREPPGDR